MLRPEYPGQPCAAYKVPGTPIILSTTVATGVIAFNTPITSAGIPNFPTRFDTYKEWRIIKTQYRVLLMSSTLPGILHMWLTSANDASAPSFNNAAQARTRRFSASANQKGHLIVHTPHDPADQIWSPIATTFTSGNFKIYTDNVNLGASTVATQYLVIEPVHTVQFRGFA